ncbi:chain length determinant protein EpsF [Derxia gummosa]|uniref:Chain length determinant protein EpsF n=1 Tax=Derxia gummosa DSM 723 TaxID=1121388 RepID=A0A8B6X9P7_9BURK|nr:chain length determinant protein EpsF [Derxia gummosa]
MNFLQLLTVVRARWTIAVAVFATVVGVTTVLSLILPKQYTASVNFVIDPKGGDVLGNSGGSIAMMTPQLAATYMATQAQILQSKRIATQVVRKLNLLEEPLIKRELAEATDVRSPEEFASEVLGKRIDVAAAKDSQLLTISVTWPNPETAAAIANGFADAYRGFTTQMRTQPARQSAEFFNEQLKTLRSDLERAQAKLSAYQQENKIAVSDARMDIESARLAELSSQLSQAQGASADARARALQGGRAGSAIPEIATSGIITQLRSEVARAQSELDQAAKAYGPNHPSYQQRAAQLQTAQASLDRELRSLSGSMGSASQASEQREAELRRAVENQRQKVLEFGRQRDDLSVLSREVDSAQKVFDLALQRFAESNIQSQASVTDATVLNAATVPAIASKPKVFLNILVSMVGGALLALCVAILVELADRRVRTVYDAADFVDAPILGVLPPASARLQGSPAVALPGGGNPKGLLGR